MTPKQIKSAIQNHRQWLRTKGEEGVRAEFYGADLRVAPLADVDLSRSVFVNCDLRYAQFKDSILREAVLRGSDLTGAVWWHGATVVDADLRGVKWGFTIPTIDNLCEKISIFIKYFRVFQVGYLRGALGTEFVSLSDIVNFFARGKLADRVREETNDSMAARLIYEESVGSLPSFWPSCILSKMEEQLEELSRKIRK